jgi:hypothetical protein
MSGLSRATAVTRYIENLRRDNQLGVNGWKDKRHQHLGSQPLLSLVEQAQMKQTLQTPNADRGLWNSRKVAEWISNLRPEGVTRELGGRADNGFRRYTSLIKAAFMGGFTG